MSNALEQFEKSLVYAHAAPASAILSDFDRIREFDKTHESKAKRSGCAGLILVPVGIFGAIGCSAIHPAAGFAWAACIGVAAIYLFVSAYRSHKQNVEDRRYELVRSIVDLLSRDADANAPITLHMSLHPPDQAKNFQTKGKTGHWNFKLYHDPWMQLDVKLLDGTSCRIQLTERIQKRQRWKTSASGKRKLKTKVKSGLELLVRLKPKARKYTMLSELGKDAQGAIQLPDWATLKGVAIDDGGLAMKAMTKVEWDAPRQGEKGQGPHGVHLVAMSMLSLYQVLNLSRAITKSQGDSQ